MDAPHPKIGLFGRQINFSRVLRKIHAPPEPVQTLISSFSFAAVRLSTSLQRLSVRS